MKGYYAIYNHRSNEWFTPYNSWIEDSDTNKSSNNIKCFSTLSEAEQYLISGGIYKNNYNDFFTIRKIYY
jgi:hypothetical protein